MKYNEFNEYEVVPIQKVLFPTGTQAENEEVIGLYHYYTYAGTVIHLTCIMLILFLHNILQNI